MFGRTDRAHATTGRARADHWPECADRRTDRRGTYDAAGRRYGDAHCDDDAEADTGADIDGFLRAALLM
ncbi:MAG: hypothetical protein NVS2B3_09820 [Vulcanimicrobiaceae bacterium]